MRIFDAGPAAATSATMAAAERTCSKLSRTRRTRRERRYCRSSATVSSSSRGEASIGRFAADAEDSCDCRRDRRRVVLGREIDEPHAVGERANHLGGQSERQARLADADRTDKRHQPHVVVEEECARLIEFPLPPDQRRCRQWQVVGIESSGTMDHEDACANDDVGPSKIAQTASSRKAGRDHVFAFFVVRPCRAGTPATQAATSRSPQCSKLPAPPRARRALRAV